MVRTEDSGLIDTSFFVVLVNKDDKSHVRANNLLEDLLQGEWGTRITTDYVLDETITVTWVRTRNKAIVKDVYGFFVGQEPIAYYKRSRIDY